MIEVVHVVFTDSSDKRHTGYVSFDRTAGGKLFIPSGSTFPTDPSPGEFFWNIASGAFYRRTDENTEWAVAGTGAPVSSQYLVLASDATLSNERVLSASTGLSSVDGGAGSSFTLTIDNNVVATISGSRFTGPVTASLGLNLASGSIQTVKTFGFDREFDNGSLTGSIQINWNNGQKQKMTLTSNNITASFISGTNPPNVGNFLLRIVQGPTGGPYTIQWPSSTILKWAGAITPTLSSGSNKEDIITFYYNGSAYYGVASLNFA